MRKRSFILLAFLVVSTVIAYLVYQEFFTSEDIYLKIEKNYYVSFNSKFVNLTIKLYGLTEDGKNITLEVFDGNSLINSTNLFLTIGIKAVSFRLPYSIRNPLLKIRWDGKLKTIGIELNDKTIVRVEGRHIVLVIKKRNFDLFKDPLDWIRKLDMAYEAYAELVGDVPYNGAKIVIEEVDKYPGGWAVAGNPIKWYSPYIPDAIKQVNEGDWLFGILHEIGHDFDLDYRWVWNAEFSANFKMVYVAEKLKAKIKEYGVWYDYSDPNGKTLDDFYAMMAAKTGETNVLKDWLRHNDAATDKFLKVKNMIGWEPFKKTYRAWLNLSSDEIPKTPEEKLNLFVYYLCVFSGKDLTQQFIEWGFPISSETVTKVREVLGSQP
ncbi:MAG: M60 family metallopeptidase [Thermoproteales archaeon]|nr:M60 family metallopeptidase [Thermoproteales archaeon]